MKLIFNDDFQKYTCSIYAEIHKNVFISQEGDSIRQTTLNEGSMVNDIKPLLIVPLNMKDDIIKAFISEGKRNHLSTENENLLKGKLEATESHLSDMQNISSQVLTAFIKIKK